MQTALDRLLILHPVPWEAVPLICARDGTGSHLVLDGRGFEVTALRGQDLAAGVVEAVNIAAEFSQIVADFHEEVLGGMGAAAAACNEPAIGFLPPEVCDGR